ncbi:biopolymer transporter ExbB [Jannaschia sp. S6380]|uniref:biopolymer transporter ExbB n=1 Tax=Jannaschia sp. S6380 TaxID=2926408 RepID=UPI001FF116AF|nr:biopolymer transporter ExbB [Jannaschia sp. S6380]MCK0168025.1 biopolymer transporter ExbB [Jannaschia sp. S6380]
MAREPLEHGTQFSQPIRQIVYMLAVLAAVGVGVVLAYPRVAPIFEANPWLNGMIIGVFVLGVIACFAQVLQLFSSVSWIEGFVERRSGHDITRPPGLLAPLAALLRSRSARSQISASSSRSILDSVGARMEEARDITRYIVNTLIFLGLLGTFWGLATTVPAVVDTIRSLNPTGEEGGMAVFGRLIGGLESQLAGMGTAFASSLLGLAGSLVVGLLELFAGHGQNRFYREMEDWLSSITRVGLVGDDGDETIDQYSLAAVLDHMNYQMENLQDMFARAEAGRLAADAKMVTLGEAVSAMADRMDGGGQTAAALDRVAEGQENIVAVLRGSAGSGDGGLDAESRMRLRSIDVQLLKVFEELQQGRQSAVDDLRGDLGALTRTLRQLNRQVQSTGGQAAEGDG